MSDKHLFTAIADPMRRQLLVALAEDSPLTATQLAHRFPLTRQGILKHLNLLAQAGLVQTQMVGREQRYSLTPEPLEDVSAWVAALGAKWDQRLQRLKAFVETPEPPSPHN